jgi:DMSO/TMAO reductase YedYZ molybdopterin-dependent catalytic subunit
MATQGGISVEELQLAARNHGMPLEALRHDVTPLGLHYLLVHYDIPVVDPRAWRLEVGGLVERPLSLSLPDLRDVAEPVTLAVTMECAGNGRARLDPRPVSQPWLLEAVGTAEWTGVPLRSVLRDAGIGDGAVEVLFTGLDRGVEGGEEQSYERSLSLDDALRDEVLLAWSVNGVALPPQHGFPLRLVVPGWYGMTSVKWLTRITVLGEPFAGYQNARAYRWREHEDDPGTPVTRIEPRSLMAPPGIPDFMTRRRFAGAGRIEVVGRAWSGFGPIETVEVSTDGGTSWRAAELGEPAGPFAWTRWSFAWDAEPGEHELCCRARDASGRAQPDAPPWNVGGYANTDVQRVPVTVR